MLELSAAARKHFEQPCYAGDLDPTEPGVVAVRVGVPTSGEILQLHLQFGANDTIAETRFKAYGCGWMIACGSLLMTQIHGQTINQARTFKHHALVEYLDIPPAKLHCAVLAETALKAALTQRFN